MFRPLTLKQSICLAGIFYISYHINKIHRVSTLTTYCESLNLNLKLDKVQAVYRILFQKSLCDGYLFTAKCCLSIFLYILTEASCLDMHLKHEKRVELQICCPQHLWAKQLNGLFTSWCTTLSSVYSEIQNTAGIALKSQRDCFSIKSGVTPVLCFSPSFVILSARAQSSSPMLQVD